MNQKGAHHKACFFGPYRSSLSVNNHYPFGKYSALFYFIVEERLRNVNAFFIALPILSEIDSTSVGLPYRYARHHLSILFVSCYLILWSNLIGP